MGFEFLFLLIVIKINNSFISTYLYFLMTVRQPYLRSVSCGGRPGKNKP